MIASDTGYDKDRTDIALMVVEESDGVAATVRSAKKFLQSSSEWKCVWEPKGYEALNKCVLLVFLDFQRPTCVREKCVKTTRSSPLD